MRAKVPKEAIQALAELAPNRSFQKVLSWLSDELEHTRKENDFLLDFELLRNQGTAITLTKLLKAAEEAT